MKATRLLSSFVLLSLASSALMAQSIVNIRLKGGTDDGPRRIVVTPNASGVCHLPPGTEKDAEGQSCPSKLEFRWVGQAADPTERIRVEYKDGLFWGEGGTPARVAPHECFDFPEDESSFELENGPTHGHELRLRPDATACPEKVAFFFDISCRGGAEGNCGGVETLDPGTMVDNGNRDP